jgi:predicted dehydrogenase
MPYRVGIVGSGFGGTVHAPAYALHPEFELVAIASPNRAKAIAAQRGIPHAFASVEEMIERLGDGLDVVSVSSPPFDHHHSVMAALAARKHVLSEKPLARTLAEAEEMTAAAARAEVAAAVSFEFRYVSAVQALRELVANGHLGPVREIETVRFGTDLRLENKRPQSTWWFDRSKGGGVAQAFMPHYIDLATYVTGGAAAHTAGFLRTANPTRTDPNGTTYPSTVADGSFALIDLGNGGTGRVTIDSTLSMDQCTVAVHGENRTAVASGKTLPEMSLYVVDGDDSSEYELAPHPHAKHAAVHPSIPAFLALLDDFAIRIATGGGPAPTFADGLAAQRVLDAIGYGA